jgi:hypothetical protein
MSPIRYLKEVTNIYRRYFIVFLRITAVTEILQVFNKKPASAENLDSIFSLQASYSEIFL